MVLLTKEQFIEKAVCVHGDRYDYSLVDYRNCKTAVKIICEKHGVFMQKPDDHLSGRNCMKCSYVDRGIEKRRRHGIDFIKEASEIHNGKYTYDFVNYIESKKPVIITCKKHGNFTQTPNSHLQGRGCSLCKADVTREFHSSNTDEFITKAKLVHGDKYNYNNVVYKNAHSKVEIICPTHGFFVQRAGRHLQGDGCPRCKDSHGERNIVNILDKYGVEYEREKKFSGCKIKNYLRFDFFIPLYNLIIEYQGKQHFAPYDRFGGLAQFMVRKRNDEYKKLWAIENGFVFREYTYRDSISFIKRDIRKWLRDILHQ